MNFICFSIQCHCYQFKCIQFSCLQFNCLQSTPIHDCSAINITIFYPFYNDCNSTESMYLNLISRSFKYNAFNLNNFHLTQERQLEIRQKKFLGNLIAIEILISDSYYHIR